MNGPGKRISQGDLLENPGKRDPGGVREITRDGTIMAFLKIAITIIVGFENCDFRIIAIIVHRDER